ncbi:Na+/H+ antiporter NhaA [Saccharobesus litoralis]|uniref:Na(+)/H(+) antiporter NhaA n=1 Tax=Saccharobesus litoralis TaxID=2172099 RepID=A0A2S0VSP5_9ALTE|nr:Na+/H+ antiporter NhaA [Saccharobesus litoralis]AWB67234.1 Na+/H+ antiporter NhaA [Saccharobesus litoralis]
MSDDITKFLKSESAGGILLMAAAVLAMVAANSPLSTLYASFIELPVVIQFGNFIIDKPLLLWINDGLMAVFFFLVGLELKREVLEGELSEISHVVLPAVGAIGGMAIPSLIYFYFNHDDPTAVNGWAIPAATDIAFALGILMLLGKRVPLALKVFLVSLAIFDDIGAIVIIALFYTSKISVTALIIAAVCIGVLFVINRGKTGNLTPFILVGVVMWVAVLKSGVHATLAGVILAMFIPMRDPRNPNRSPLHELEHDLHSVVAVVVLPLFAFVNSGIPLGGVGIAQLLHDVPVGIALGLIVGKQVGIFGFCWAMIKLGWAELPKNVNLPMLYGASLLCGVGFTMSMFIGSLAFEDTGENLIFDERLGIIAGSLVSGVLGYLVLNAVLPKLKTNPTHATNPSQS